MNATPTQKDWDEAIAAAVPETTNEIVPETRQEKAILTGDYAGSVEAILMDMDVREKLDRIAENLDSAHALMHVAETHDRAMEVYSAANRDIHELEGMTLTESEKAELSKLGHRLIEIGLEFAAPSHTMGELADMECPK